jgi:hypothetical protein
MLKTCLPFIVLFFCPMLIIACTKDDQDVVCKYIQQGRTTRIISGADSLVELTLKLFKNCDLQYELIVNQELTDSIRENNSCLEIEFPELIIVETKINIKYKIRKVLIPLSGKFYDGSESANVVLFLGDSEYFSGPLGNSDAKLELNKIRKIIQIK